MIQAYDNGSFYGHIGTSGIILRKCFKLLLLFRLRTDSCDERRVYKSEDISGPKGDRYMFDTSPKSLDFCLSKDVW